MGAGPPTGGGGKGLKKKLSIGGFRVGKHLERKRW